MQTAIHQALKKAIAAHKEGRLDDAGSLYRDILKSLPGHPDANHNLGLITAASGQLKKSLPLFKAALEGNPRHEQFWVSYIDSLIKLGQIDKARKFLLKGKKKSMVVGEKIDYLESQLLKDTKEKGVSFQKSLKKLLHLYNGKRFKEALVLAKNLTNRFPRNTHVLNILGAICSHLGKHEDAILIYKKAIELDPSYDQAHNNFGIQLTALGKNKEAIIYFKNALKLNANYAEAYNNLGITLNKLDRLEEAIASYKKAIEVKPDYAEAHYNLGNKNKEIGQLSTAIKNYTQALAINPNYVDAHNNIAVVLQELGQHNEAMSHFKVALEFNACNANALNNLGITLSFFGRYDEAIASYKKAIEVKPDYAEAHSNLGNLLHKIGNTEAALQSYMKLLTIDSDNKLFWAGFSEFLHPVRFKSFNDKLFPFLEEALNQSSVGPTNISGAIASILKIHPLIQSVMEAAKADDFDQRINQIVGRLTDIPLLLQLMELAPIPDSDIERLLRLVRKISLKKLLYGEIEYTNLPFYSALALHCFINEYVYLETFEENSGVSRLEEKIKEALKSGEFISPVWIALLGSYRPLHSFEWAGELSKSQLFESISKLITQQICEVEEERLLALDIKILGPINNKISVAVSKQYQENPYPRWIKLSLSPQSQKVEAVLRQLDLRLDTTNLDFIDYPEILIAGCGTGKHSLTTATRFANSKVLAVDLSLNSLSYALRKTKELAVENIEYMQADILKLKELNRKFDLIECTGVLHHMEKPLEGWRILVDLLRSGGLMKIGLYSEIARQHIIEMRNVIHEGNYDASPEAIRQFRAEVMDSETNAIASGCLSAKDFYSLSSCRDLLFHVQEHRFTLPEIETALESLGAEFIGFELTNPQIKNNFQEINPGNEALTSLSHWHQFEQNNTDTFAGMYQFWVQKI